MRPWFTKFSGVLYDKRWLNTVDKIYQIHYRSEPYLRNISNMARVGMLFSEKSSNNGREIWQQKSGDHPLGMYHALIEERIPFEMVNDRILDEEHLKPFKLLILPNIASLSNDQCDCLKKFVKGGGSLVATFETSLYDEAGRRRMDFGLADILGISFDKKIEGPLQNSYLRLKTDAISNQFHPVLQGLEDAYRIINTSFQVSVFPRVPFISPVTLVPTYPDLPMEDVYPRTPETEIRELYLRDSNTSRIAYFPGDIDRIFWQVMSADHGKLLGNTIRWALNEEPIVEVKGQGIIDVTVWRQESSMTVHLVNLTNPMMMKGPHREFIPVDQQVSIKIPDGLRVTGVNLLVRDKKAEFKLVDGKISLLVNQIQDYEIIGIDLI
jgi:hypothetical protein